jgi:uncharacterized protein YndB with AHSA1/START domain
MERLKIVGRTKDAGFQIGVRKTFPVSAEQAWEFLFSAEGLSIWLGEVSEEGLGLKKSYTTKEGVEGKINVFKPYSHIRLTWKRKSWDNTSAVQVRIIDAKGKATISFHQDKLWDINQRAEMKLYWDKIVERIGKKLNIEQ